MAETLGVGVIGTGGMGGRHARNLAQTAGARVAAIMDLDAARAGAVAADCGGAVTYTDADALIVAADVDAVVIASPDPTHADLAIGCVEAGKPVLCEKPLATSLADAARVVQAEAAAGRRLVQVGFMRVYDPAHVDLKDLIGRGEIGRPLRFQSGHCNTRFAEPRTVTDAITNSAVHDFHSARWLMGQEIATVYASHVRSVAERPETCRLLLVHLAFADGAVGTVEVNSDSGYGYEVTVEIAGEEGVARTAGLSSPALRKAGNLAHAVAPDWLVRFADAYVVEVGDWVAALRAGAPTGPSAWDGYMSLAIADACVRSVDAGAPQEVRTMDRPELYVG